MAPLHPLDSATATLDGATPVNANSPAYLRNDEQSSSEKVRLSPDVQLGSSTATSVLGGGEYEHEPEHESMTRTEHEREHDNNNMGTESENNNTEDTEQEHTPT